MDYNLESPTTLLTQIEAGYHLQEAPDFDFTQLVPIRQVAPTTESVMSFAVTLKGEAKLLSGIPGEKLNSVDFKAKSTTASISDWGLEYNISQADIRAGVENGNLDPLEIKVESAFNAYRRSIQRLVLTGNDDLGAKGLMNMTGFSSTAVNANTGKKWNDPTKTAQSIVDDLVGAFTSVLTQTQSARRANTVVMHESMYILMASKRFDGGLGITALDAFEQTAARMNGGVLPTIILNSEFKTDILVYSYDPAVLSMYMAQPLVFFPEQPEGLGFKRPAMFRVSPIQIRNNYAFHKLTNVL